MIGERLSMARIIQRSVGVIDWPLFLRRRGTEGLKVFERCGVSFVTVESGRCNGVAGTGFL